MGRSRSTQRSNAVRVREKPAPQVLADAQRIHARLVRSIRALPDDEQEGYWSAWRNHQPPWRRIAANTYAHYEHRLKPLEQCLHAQAYAPSDPQRCAQSIDDAHVALRDRISSGSPLEFPIVMLRFV